ncbi:4'-phosphopantetheinyl transferase [Marininema mesophilum]|uniref:4'-phosphopantetheinyl transferase n=1 Tax=Marininema mesophilum TaxID=1048340 RepID=A0A1H3C723_9BACL|nr:4'-phosphopantetheinyl transferase superfamily protein [Marininema mesophilum]SDX49967.1 4'-phosphopantetheinyl transferase [Marininema mesophilum]
MEHPIHVFYVKIPQIPIPRLTPYLSILDEEEKCVFHRYKVDHKKVEFLLGRLLLKGVLAKKLRVSPHEIAFSKNEYGKLFLIQNSEPAIHFNLSHTKGLLACVVTKGVEVGIDVEGTEEDHLEVMKTVFVDQEISYIQNQKDLQHQKEAFYLIWTRKEAVMKAIGKGFSLPPLSFSVPVDRNHDNAFTYFTDTPTEGFLLSCAIKETAIEPNWCIQEVLWGELLD